MIASLPRAVHVLTAHAAIDVGVDAECACHVLRAETLVAAPPSV
jgi:hypothetical protein